MLPTIRSPQEMSSENQRDRDKIDLNVQGRSPDNDHRIAEAEAQLINTRAFLERIAEGDERTHKHIADMLHHIERQLQNLRIMIDQEAEAGSEH